MKILFTFFTIFVNSSFLMAQATTFPAGEKLVMEPELVVTASRTSQAGSRVTAATQVISQQHLRDSGAENVSDILEQQAGIHIERQVGGDAISLQGLGSEYVLILVDGERIAGRINGVIDLSRYSIENIERIEIVRGAGSSLYGSEALGGIVNIITRKGLKSGYEFSTKSSYGMLNQFDNSNSLELQIGKWSLSTFGGFHRRDAFDLNHLNLTTDGSQLNKFNIGQKSTYNFSESNQLVIRSEYIQRQSDNIEAAETGAIYDLTNLTEVLQNSVAQSFSFENSNFQYKVNHSYFKDQFRSDQRFDTVNDTLQKTADQIAEVNLKWEYLGFKDHHLIAGVDNISEHLATPRVRENQADRLRSGIFVQNEWQIFERNSFLSKFILVPGLRGDFDSLFDYNFSPKLGLRLDLGKSAALKASYGWGFRAPDFKQLYLLFENFSTGYVVEGNPNLKAEKSISYNLGLDWEVVKKLKFNINFFHNELSNLIDADLYLPGNSQNLTRYRYINIFAALTQGLEFMASYDWSTKLLLGNFAAGYTFTDSLDKRYDLPLTARPKHMATLSWDIEFRSIGLRISSKSKFTDRRPYNISTTSTPEYFYAKSYLLLDGQAQLELKLITLFLRAENILNAGEETYLAIAPFSINGGASLQLKSHENKNQ